MRAAPFRTFVGLLLLSTLFAGPSFAQTEPTVFICGVWPDRILFFDQTTDEFSEGLRLRHGAVTRTAYTSDRRKFFVVTDRMESVEIIDPLRKEIVGEFKLSTPERRVRFFGVFPNASGTQAYLTYTATELQVDRFIREDAPDVLLFDVEKNEVVDEFSLPDRIGASGRPALHVSPDGSSLFVITDNIYEIDAKTHEIIDTLEISKPLQAGYGPFRGIRLTETEPGMFFAIYRTTDPIQEKKLFGLAKLDLYGKKVSTFELGPELEVGQFALSPDKKRGYAGLNDMVVIDMETQKVLVKAEGFERGRANNSMIVSHDGTKLYISGVGDTVYVYDASTLEPIKTVYAGGDFMMPPVEILNPTSPSSP